MDIRPVLFFDSGIGGIPYCSHFHSRNPQEPLIYLADRLHFPYGKRDRAELVSVLIGLFAKIIALENPKIAVLACNTATVSALAELRDRFPALPFVGTVPAVKPAVSGTKTGKVGVLGTERTIEEPYIRELADRYGKNCEITGLAAPDMVEFVEQRIEGAGEDEKLAMVRPYVKRFREIGVDSVVLGCTHFLFLLDEFHKEAAPDIRVFDSIEGISRRVETLLNKNDLRADASLQSAAAGAGAAAGQTSAAPRVNRFYLTGSEAPEQFWQDRAGRMGFRLSLLERP
jgi:glutamate racemase